MPIFKITIEIFYFVSRNIIMTFDSNNSADVSDLNDVPGIDNNDDDFETIERAKRNCEARKRIDDLLEKKRLKELLDDEDDW